MSQIEEDRKRIAIILQYFRPDGNFDTRHAYWADFAWLLSRLEKAIAVVEAAKEELDASDRNSPDWPEKARNTIRALARYEEEEK